MRKFCLSIAVFMLWHSLPGWGQSICDPDAEKLLPSSAGADLDVTSAVKVNAGEYRYGNVHIYNDGTLCFEDEKIDFWTSAILIENTGSMIAGKSEHPIGRNGGQLTIHLYGKDQGPNGRGVACKTDAFCGVPETIWNAGDGQKVALPGGAEDDYFYPYTPLMFDDADPHAYFGYKVLGVAYGGSLQLFGAKGASYQTINKSDSGTSWVRLARTLRPNTEQSNIIVLDRPVDWAVGDQIVVTATDYLPGHSEQFTIESVSADKKTLTVTENAKYIHNGEPYLLADTPSREKGYKRLGLDITVDGEPAAETRAAVGLLTRSIRIVSGGDSLGEGFPTESQLFPSTEQPGEQHPYYFGGHVVIRQGVAKAQTQGVEFYQLGQGGRMGHYPIHFHMARKTPPDTFVKDSSIHDSMTRWITLHGTQNVLLARNVGYKSIGHGFYLEDGSEINNQLYANLGVLARAAVDNPHNPRKVPGILAWTENKTATDIVPSHSDYAHPTVFWLMNTWNDVDHNMAAGATACGSCYWPLPGIISGPSAKQKWDSYASLQTFPNRAGATPLKSFTGNYCTTAMNSFNATANVSLCNGLGTPAHDAHLEPIPNPLAPRPIGWDQDTYYPRVDPGGQRFGTRCDEKSIGAIVDPDTGDVDCSNVPRCSESNKDGCMVTVLDRYTTSFHWTETNFSAIWLRPQWSLVQNSVISDVQNAGLTFVTGGDYTKSSSIDGNWLLARKNVFIGHTQADNPNTADWGPFNAQGLSCDNKNSTVNYCVSIAEGIALPLSNWANNQRLFNIYDGPAQQDSNAYLDITRRPVDDCQQDSSGNCQDSESMYGRVLGMPFDQDAQQCYLPNAAIAWKQPNGFYYPPSFHSRNLYFDNVDIRHFVIEPLFEPGTRKTDEKAVRQNYCTFNADNSFIDFTDVDRQTVLNDDDGSLTGLVNTISVNEDPFFNAPVEAVECASEGTAKTSPYQYVTTALYPGCAVRGDCGENDKIKTGQPPVAWNKACTDKDCYGVPLYRQYLTAQEYAEQAAPSIRLMSQAMWQRSNLTPNHGVFYIDTTVSREVQESELPPPPTNPEAIHTQKLNVFQKNETYYVYLVFATPEARQTYQIYVGKDFDQQSLRAVTTTLAGTKLRFNDEDWPSSWEIEPPQDGVLTVTLDMNFDDFKKDYNKAKLNSCQPKSFCELNDKQHCVSVAEDKELDAACAWAGVDVDCPEGGCYGFAFTLPNSFRTLTAAERADPAINPHPQAQHFPSDANWDVAWRQANPDLAGADCFDPPVEDTQFYDLQTTPLFSTNIIYGSDRSEQIQGTDRDDIILGLKGDDVIDGLAGDDWISGGPGNDQVLGGEGNDFLNGDEGDDDLMGGADDDSLDGGEGNDMLLGEAGEDVLTGGEGNDFLYGGEGDDLISGDEGDDTCATVHEPSGCEQAF